MTFEWLEKLDLIVEISPNITWFPVSLYKALLMDETGIVKSYIMYHWFASQLTFLTHLFSPCNQIDAFKLTKSHKRDKNCKKNSSQWEEKLVCYFFVIQAPQITCSESHPERISTKEPVIKFHIHFPFHWSSLWDLWPLCACFAVTKNNEQCVFLFTACKPCVVMVGHLSTAVFVWVCVHERVHVCVYWISKCLQFRSSVHLLFLLLDF